MLQSAEANDQALLPSATLTTAQYNDRLVKLAYANVLGRAPTDAELAAALARIGGAAAPNAQQAAFLVDLGVQTAGYNGDDAAAQAARTLLFDKVTICLAYAAMDAQGGDPAQTIAVNRAAIAAVTTAASARAAAQQATLFLKTQAQAALALAGGTGAAAGATPLESLRLKLARLYAVLLGRAPDHGGFDFWMAQLKNAGPGALAGVAGAMLGQEGSNAALYPPSLSDSAFLARLFSTGLGMVPGAALDAAVAAWLPRLQAGAGRAQVAVDAIDALANSGAPADQARRNLLANKAAVGVNYAMVLGGADQAIEKNILTLVTDSDIKNALDAASLGVVASAAASAAATAADAAAAAAQNGVALTAANLAVAAQARLAPAQAGVNANALAAPLLRAVQLYVTVLNRGAPGYAAVDLAGVINMAQAMQAGQSDLAMAQNMFDSPEGRALFPSANYSATQFVTQLFRQALGRDPEPGALAFWAAAAATPGARAQVALDLVKAFLENPVADSDPAKAPNLLGRTAFYARMGAALGALSTMADAAAAAQQAALDADNKAKAAATASAAAATAAGNAAATNARSVLEVTRLFVGVLNRGPGAGQKPVEVGGLNFWTRARLQGASLETIAGGFLASAEGLALFQNAGDNRAFINQLYRQVLGHDLAPGDTFWLNALNGGASRGAIAAGIITSVTEQTGQTDTEYLVRAGFDQRVGDAMQTLAGLAGAAAAAAQTDVGAKQQLKDAGAAAVPLRLADYAAAVKLTVEGDPNVVAAKAAAPGGLAFLGSNNLKAVTELLVAFHRPADYDTVAALLKAVDAGTTTLAAIIGGFTLSLADRPAFFTDLYTKVLGRAPDPGGRDWWVGATAGMNDPGQVAYAFFTGALGELYKPTPGSSVRLNFLAEYNAVANPNLARANALAMGYAAAQETALAQIAQKKADTLKAYNDAVEAARQADLAWQDAGSINTVAKVAGAALAAAGTVQTATVAADKATAAALTAAAKLPALATALGLPAAAKLADFAALAANAAAVKQATVPDLALESVRSDLASAELMRTNTVQNPAGATAASPKVYAVTQLYVALLGRAPTLLELNLALGSLKNGMAMDALGNAVVAANPSLSPAGAGNDAFVTRLYQQVMGRAPEPAGLRFWSDMLNGPNGASRGALALGIVRGVTADNITADSVAFDTRVATALSVLGVAAQSATLAPNLADFITANTQTMRAESDGYDQAAQAALPDAARYQVEITQLYLTLLGRSPEAAALVAGVAQRGAGVPLAAIAQAILAAPETRARLDPAMGDAQFAAALYTLGLGRAPDGAEQAAAAAALQGGGPAARAQLVLSVLRDLYDYRGNDIGKAAARTTFVSRVAASLERSVGEVAGYAAGFQKAADRSAAMALSATLDTQVDARVLGRDNVDTAMAPVNPARLTVDRWGNVLTVTRPARRRTGRPATPTTTQPADRPDRQRAGRRRPARPTAATSYDALGRMVLDHRREGNVDRLGYDANGNVITGDPRRRRRRPEHLQPVRRAPPRATTGHRPARREDQLRLRPPGPPDGSSHRAPPCRSTRPPAPTTDLHASTRPRPPSRSNATPTTSWAGAPRYTNGDGATTFMRYDLDGNVVSTSEPGSSTTPPSAIPRARSSPCATPTRTTAPSTPSTTASPSRTPTA